MRAFVGTSGWHYADWRGRFYPEGLATGGWLERYARVFPTVEVNATFYRLPQRETVERWATTVPKGFLLTLKASRYVTHIRRLRDCREPIERMRSVFWGAGPHLGAGAVPAAADIRGRRRAAPILPGGAAPGDTGGVRVPPPLVVRGTDPGTDGGARGRARPRRSPRHPRRGARRRGWSYLRFHQGRPDSPGYRRSKLADYADALVDVRPREVFAYFNNDTGGAAPEDAQTFMELLADRQVELAA